MSEIKEISVRDIYDLCASSAAVNFFDVREPNEYAAIRTDLARNIPLSSFDPAAVQQQFKLDPSAPVYLVCRSGKRSYTACQKLAAHGFAETYNVVGGMLAWEEEDLPISSDE